MPSERDMSRAARGYLTEIEQWIMLLIHFLEAKLPHDPDFQVLSSLIRTLHLDTARGQVPPGKIFEIIGGNRTEEARAKRASTNTLDDYLASLTAARAALSGIGAPAYHTERLLEIADVLLESEQLLQQEITEAIEGLLVSAAHDPIAHQLEVRSAVLTLATTLERDEHSDHTELDRRGAEAVTHLAHLLGGLERARGICEALHILRFPPQARPDEDSAGAGPVLAA